MKHYLSGHPALFQKTNILKSQSGFTFIELLVVIIIIAALLSMAMPTFETMVFGSSSNRAVLELVSELQLARMKAIRLHREVTVSFNDPAQDQYTVSWTDDTGGTRTKIVQLDPKSRRVSFDDSPPGGGNPPDTSFTFTELGFSKPSSGGRVGFIYLVDKKNERRFGVVSTVAGGIEELVWSGDSWSGPDYQYTSVP